MYRRKQTTTVLQTAHDITWSISWDDLRLVRLSPEGQRLLGRTAEHPGFAGKRAWKHLLLSADRRAFRAFLRALPEHGELEIEHRIALPGGRTRWMHSSGRLARGADGQPLRVDGRSHDVTELREVEQRLARLGNMFQALRQTSQAIAHLTEPDALFREICRVAVEHGKLRLAWVGLVGQDNALRISASYGAATGYLEGIRVGVDPTQPEGQGAAGLAIRSGAHIILNDFLGDPRSAPWHERARAAGLRANASFPIRMNGDVIGALGLYADEKDFFDGQLIELLDQMVLDISFALEGLHREERRRAAEAQLLLAAEVIERSVEAVMITDAADRIGFVNLSFTTITGHRREDVLGQTPAELGMALYGADSFADVWDAVRKTGHWQGELADARKTGERYSQAASVSAVRDEQGGITHYIITFSDVTERRTATDWISYLATHDELTGLPNRQRLLDLLDQAMTAASDAGDPIALLYIDIDRFQLLNESLGHQGGDQVLAAVADRLRTLMRRDDTVARQGGDEFVVMVQHCPDNEDLGRAAERILAGLAIPMQVADSEISLSACIGIAMYPRDGRDPHDLLRSASTAVHRTKGGGLNTYQFFQPEMNAQADRQLRLRSGLSRALERGEFELFYQPQVSAATGRLVGVEALARWRHPDLGLISPGRFIPAAEASGLIVEIGEWTLYEATRHVRDWQRAGLPLVPVAVNVSALQLGHRNSLDVVREALTESGISPEYLEIELTESLAMSDVTRARAVWAG